MDNAGTAIAEVQSLFINSQWVKPDSGRYFSTINPATEEAITQVPLAGERETDLAVAAARRAFETGPWGKMKPGERGKILYRLAAQVEKQAEELALVESLDVGKPLAFTRTRDVPFAIDLLRYYAGWANKIYGTTLPTDESALACTVREPIGVVAIITPWNSPLILSLMKIAPALAMGNTLIHKPASWTPLSALKFAEICQNAGVPEGVYNVVTGKKEGAKLILGGDRPPMKKGYYLNPTVFDAVENSLKLAREEIFGPVLAVIPFKEFDEVIEKANDTFYGLASGVWTSDMKKAYHTARRLKAGSVWVNCYGALDVMAPFGGFKQSGFGREFGQEVLPLYTETKTVWFQM